MLPHRTQQLHYMQQTCHKHALFPRALDYRVTLWLEALQRVSPQIAVTQDDFMYKGEGLIFWKRAVLSNVPAGTWS